MDEQDGQDFVGGMGTLVRYGRGTTNEREWTLIAYVLSDSLWGILTTEGTERGRFCRVNSHG